MTIEHFIFKWQWKESDEWQNKKILKNPFPKAKFELKHSVLNVDIGYNNWAVIVERLPEKVRDKDEKEEIKKRSKNIARYTKIYSYWAEASNNF